MDGKEKIKEQELQIGEEEEEEIWRNEKRRNKEMGQVAGNSMKKRIKSRQKDIERKNEGKWIHMKVGKEDLDEKKKDKGAKDV